MSCPITNKEFLAAIRAPADKFGLTKNIAKQWFCHFGQAENWKGRVYDAADNIEYAEHNTYFSISLFESVDGAIARKKDNFVGVMCIVLDDVGTKAKTPDITPSWKLETSPGNEQWGFILDRPIQDANLATNIIKKIADKGYCDKNALGPTTRYMRLPIGSNSKPQHTKNNDGKPIPHILKFSQLNQWFSLEEIAYALDFKLDEGTKNNQTNEKSSEIIDCKDIERLSDSDLISQICSGENYHGAILTLSARYQHRKMSRSDIIATIQGFMEVSNDDTDSWRDRYNDIARLVDGAFRKFQDEEEDEPSISYTDFQSLSHELPPERQWIVPEWLPRGTVTLLAGAGGVGKSLLAQQLAISVANGDGWIGLDTVQGNTLGFFCEDDRNEMLRRAHDIFTANFYDPTKASRNLFLDARAGKHNTLSTFDFNKNLELTAFMREIHQQCTKIQPALVIFDNVAQMFSGSEIDRMQVTVFCNMLSQLAIKYNCAVLLLSHPAKMIGSEFSGSTAWEAAVRTRLFLNRNEDATLTLKKAKANYSALDDIKIKYHNGCFSKFIEGDELPEIMEDAQNLILQSINSYTSRQDTCSHSSTARNYIVRKICDDGHAGKFSFKMLEQALYTLLDKRVLLPNLELGWRNASRHKVFGLKISDKAIEKDGDATHALLPASQPDGSGAIAQEDAVFSPYIGERTATAQKEFNRQMVAYAQEVDT